MLIDSDSPLMTKALPSTNLGGHYVSADAGGAETCRRTCLQGNTDWRAEGMPAGQYRPGERPRGRTCIHTSMRYPRHALRQIPKKKGAILAPQMYGIRVPNLTESYGIVRNRTESEPNSFFGRAFSHVFVLSGVRNQRNHLNSL